MSHEFPDLAILHDSLDLFIRMLEMIFWPCIFICISRLYCNNPRDSHLIGNAWLGAPLVMVGIHV